MIADAVSLNEGEKIVQIIRRHWFNLAIEGMINIFVFLILTAAVIAVDSVVIVGEVGIPTGAILPLGFFGISFIGLFLWMHFFASWSDHWLDAWIITTERVVDIEQKGFFTREVSSFPLSNIQDVTYSVSGVIPTWLHFGDVRIQTASVSEDLIMKQVPFPQDIKEQLVNAIGK